MGSSPGEASRSAAADVVARAHAQLLKQSDLQFSFTAPDKPPEAPGWLKAFAHWLANVLHAAGPTLKWMVWIGMALIVGLMLFFIAREVFGLRLGRRRRAPKPPPVTLDDDWRPNAARARTLLEDADRLAAEGLYSEAVHLLLFRSIEDIDKRWPRLVQPALTSRDIAGHPTLPEAARITFAAIARTVERGFFGGQAIAADDFERCRRDYEAFALPARA
ncbi:MAG TPA: hypothetical protein VGI79_21225 [Caulobacteraceae bacterium]